tara:strand:- start:3764 stop:6241 length:2478 start_codon:yes stop_codon:yes gene_type:complete
MKPHCAIWIAAFAFVKFATAQELAILPSTINLSGPESTQRLIIALQLGEGEYSQGLDGVALASDNPKVAQFENGAVIPKSNGTATIVATTTDGKTAKAVVTVRDFGQETEWSFRNHVQPVLAKQGCNMGACHGALAGKGGFRLSLRGYDPEADHHTITREARGRRIELNDPGRSLLLTKATTALKHTGGRQIVVGSRDYEVLSRWIAEGAKPPQARDPRLTHLEIFPPLSILKPGDKQRIVVRATYSDGREEDVTHWAKFTSSNEAVALVDEDGSISVIGPGEGAVTAWFSSQIVTARISAPFPHQIPAQVYARESRNNFIDAHVLDQLERLNLKPSPRSTDSEFIRRVHLDTIGLLPTPAETRAFLADSNPKKRERLIDALLRREEYVDYWAYRWSDMLLVNGRKLRPEAVKAYYSWIRSSVEKNLPWDEMARQIVTATGSSVENGATNFFAVHQDPENMAENVSQAFLSLSINCAKCHNHPLEKWTNDQYYQFANLFSRVRAKGWGGDARNGNGIRTLYVEPRGELIQPRTGQPQIPAPLDAEPIDPDDTRDRREVLAAWLTSPDNNLFSRSITNRVWANFFGIGLVDPVDDLRASNPASNEPVLHDLANYLVQQNFDLKAVMRLILQSETYQRSSVPLAENKDEHRYFSRYYPRRLMAEVLHDAVAGITEVPTAFNQITLSDGSVQKTEFYDKGTRAIQLFDSAVASYFLKTFGRNDREISCECERSNQPSLVQVLHVSNGSTLNDKLKAPESIVTSLTKDHSDDRKIVEQAYLLCLSRVPTEREASSFAEILASTPPAEKRIAVEDLFWSLMSSREFLFQH